MIFNLRKWIAIKKYVKTILLKITSFFANMSKILLYIVIGFILSVGAMLYFSSFDQDTLNVIRSIASILLVLSIVIAAANLFQNQNQIQENREWNQKDAAMKALHEAKKTLSKANQKLDPILHVNHRIQHNLPFTAQEIHNLMGVFLTNGDFIFHGEHSQQHIKNAQIDSANGYNTDFCDKTTGRDLYNEIELILNEFEYICMACNEQIFDPEIVIELRGSGIIRIFNVFSNYIYHMRYDKRHNYGPRLYSHFEKFAHYVEKYLDDKRLTVREPVEAEYLTPFDKKA